MEVKSNIQEKLKKLPNQSGVYIMLDKSGEVLYVGKAKILKNRVRQYFSASKKPEKVSALVRKIEDFRYIVTESEMDALSLENNLIKQYSPQYNFLLKDDKEYAYIKVDVRSNYPKIIHTRKVENDNARYYGPFASGIKSLLTLLQEEFPTITCNFDMDKLPKNFRPCLKRDLKTCSAPCDKSISKEDYRKIIERALDFLDGNDSEIKKSLTQKMLIASQNMQFENAIIYRSMLSSLDSLREKRIINVGKLIDVDIYSIVSNGFNSAVNVLYVRKGKVIFGDNYLVDDANLSLEGSLSSFISLFSEQTNSNTREIITNVKLSDNELLEMYLTKKTGRKIAINFSQRGIKHQLVLMGEKNAVEFLDKRQTKDDKEFNQTEGAVKQLKTQLELSVLPNRIECFDISHISGVDKVASMVVFTNGKKDSKAYRRFKIKTVEGNNDFACMKEVLLRRFERLKNNDTAFGKRPDLIIVDGGKGQLTYAMEALRESQENIQIVSLAKRFELVYKEDREMPYELEKNGYAYNLVVSIRDEAHRFAITYHRGLHGKNTITSTMKQIEGMGDKRIKNLQRYFKSMENIKNASVEELITSGLPKNVAQNVFDFFHS